MFLCEHTELVVGAWRCGQSLVKRRTDDSGEEDAGFVPRVETTPIGHRVWMLRN